MFKIYSKNLALKISIRMKGNISVRVPKFYCSINTGDNAIK